MDRALRSRKSLTSLLTAAILIFGSTVASAEPATLAEPATSAEPATASEPAAPADPAQLPAPAAPSGTPSYLGDVGRYFTAPFRWDRSDWAWCGGAVLAIGLAHRYDSQVRTHFFGRGPTANVNSEDTKDAIPTATVFGGTWAFALLTRDRDGYREGWAMAEAAALSGVTAYALKFAAGRQTPEQTTNPNEWFRSGSSFPSFHSTEAFAVGTVLAESGNDAYRFLRRLLGYGLGIATSYERLKHNAHWLSDTVAGAALGISSAHFAMDRRYASDEESHLALVPIAGGAMLTYRVSMR
jgi:membrane-associated phospholipid phosphatase